MPDAFLCRIQTSTLDISLFRESLRKGREKKGREKERTKGK
jgi:hypothetical protein